MRIEEYMAADERKKRLNALSTINPSSEPSHKVKRKKLGFHTTSNISLEWDGANKSVVAKRDQAAISRRHFIPFLNALPSRTTHNVLADLITIPREIFGLQNLAKLLTYEVWETCLSESERRILTQFLPKGSDPDEIVQQLLGGDNFHFGNPFLKWGSLLCSGNSHPDNIVYQEQCNKSIKKAYYLDLSKYHNDMIESLQIWKENLSNCEDPEEEIVKRTWRKGSTGTFDNSSDGLKITAKPRKGERLMKRNIQHGDGAKYMSYIKVSKAQHQRVKSSMKHNSNSIQPKSLNNVLGNIDDLRVQPFEVYEEEERKKLHEHWLKLVNRDLSAAFANWNERKLKRLQLKKYLGEEMDIKLRSQTESTDEGEEEKGDSDDIMSSPEHMDDDEVDVVSTVAPIMTMEGPTITGEDEKLEADMEIELPNGVLEAAFEDEDREKSECIPVDRNAEKCVLVNLQHTVSENLESFGNQTIEEEEEASLENVNDVVDVEEGDSLVSVVDTWQQVGIPPTSYYHPNHHSSSSSSMNHEYSSPQVEEQPAPIIIDLEEDDEEKDSLKESMFFNPNEDRNEVVFQSLLKSEPELNFQPSANLMIDTSRQFSGAHVYPPVVPLSLPRQKSVGEFYNHQNMIPDSMFPIERQQVLPLPLPVQDWGVHRMPAAPSSQPHLINGVGELGSQSWFPGENHQGRRVRGGGGGGWSCMDGGGSVAGPSRLGIGSNCDESLFSVLSECNELRQAATTTTTATTTTYDSTGRYMQQPGIYGAEMEMGLGMGMGMGMGVQSVAATTNPLMNNYLNGHEGGGGNGGYNTNTNNSSSNKSNTLGWMNMNMNMNMQHPKRQWPSPF